MLIPPVILLSRSYYSTFIWNAIYNHILTNKLGDLLSITLLEFFLFKRLFNKRKGPLKGSFQTGDKLDEN